METKCRKNKARPRYDDVFKERAVYLVVAQGRPCSEVAQELGVCISTLHSWIKAVEEGPSCAAGRCHHTLRRLQNLQAENKALRKQVAEKDAAIDILKKSVCILSRP